LCGLLVAEVAFCVIVEQWNRVYFQCRVTAAVVCLPNSLGAR